MVRRKNETSTENCSNCSNCGHCGKGGKCGKSATKSNEVETSRSAGKRERTTSRSKATRSKNSK